MNIVVITGSPHRKGTSSLLAEMFIKGAEEAGHDVYCFDAAFKKIHPCIGCGRCDRLSVIHCGFKGDMDDELYQKILQTDLIAGATGFITGWLSPQILATVSRFSIW